MTCRVIFTALLALSAPTLARATDSISAQPPINYPNANSSDPVARLQKQLDAGKLQLAYTDLHGYLESILTALGVPASSQTLVFSKTSFQRELISPSKPRAPY